MGELFRWEYRDVCAAVEDLESLRGRLEYFRIALHVAEGVPFFNRNNRARERLQRGRRTLGRLLDRWEQIGDVCGNLEAIEQIQRGVRTLNEIGSVHNNPAEAARAFGQIFAGLGQFAAFLPAPLDEYAAILQECGNFFTNMRSGLDPNERYRDREDWRIGNQGMGAR
jgi:hypothetical protein